MKPECLSHFTEYLLLYNAEDFKFGLGLSIVKKIVELHRATISVYTVSDNIHPDKKGKDVCFSIRFPLTKET